MRGLIFDMDGTLVDSMGLWRSHLHTYLTEKGVCFPTNLEARVNESGSFNVMMELLAISGIKISRQEMIDEYQGMMAAEYCHHITLKPNVRTFLDQEQAKGRPMCIATATPRELFLPMLRRLELEDYFQFLITVPEIGVRKSAPDIYQYCSDQFGLPASACAVFEDTIQAVRTAKKAGFYTIGVADATSYWARADIQAVADRYITDFAELLEEAGR